MRYCHLATPRFFHSESISTHSSFPIDIIPIIAQYLQLDRASGTVASLQSLCRTTYYLITPILYAKIRITEHSWDKLFGLFENVSRSEIHPPAEVIKQVVANWRQPLDLPAYVRLRWFFSLIKLLVLVSFGALDSSKTACTVNESLFWTYRQHLLSGLESIHVTEEYTARSILDPTDHGDPLPAFEAHEVALAALCPPHQLCISIPKEDGSVEGVSLGGSRVQVREAVDKAARQGIRSMLGGRAPKHSVNAKAITYHNVNARYVMPPQSGQTDCRYNLSFIHSTASTADDRESHTLGQRAHQIAEFILVLCSPLRRAPRPGPITIFRPLSKVCPESKEQLVKLKERVEGILVEVSSDWTWASRSEILAKVHEVKWVMESEMQEDDLHWCPDCDGEWWPSAAVIL
jgi:hypothetical protein